jgi:hypothetical protein
VKKLPAFASAWLAQRRSAATELTLVAEEELRNLSDEEALRRSDALLSMGRSEELSAERRSYSGFVEQQRRFHQARR